MNSGWATEIIAIFEKEWRVELRARTGWITAFLFGFTSVFVIAMATFGTRLDGGTAAGLLWAVLLFAAVLALPRVFVSEEEQGTADLLRMAASPFAVFWGKTLFNLVQMSVLGAILALLFLGLTGLEVPRSDLLVGGVGLGCLALAGTTSLCGALVAQAAQRTALAAVVALPLLLPVAILGVAVGRVAFGVGSEDSARQALVGLAGYGGLTLATGPWVYAAITRS